MLKTLISVFICLTFVLSSNSLKAQSDSCTCKEDFDFLHEKVKKSPPYKTEKKITNDLYLKLSEEIKNVDSDYECFVLLNRFLMALNDNHSNVYGSDTGATTEIREDETKYKAFKKSELFDSYPRPEINIDSLLSVLDYKAISEIEGIYTIPDKMTIAVYSNSGSNEFMALVVDSEMDLWARGELLYTMIPYGNDYLRCIGGSLSSKRMIAYSERIKEGIFLTMGFQKDTTSINYSKSIHADAKYIRQEISPEISYIKIGSFSGMYPTLSDAENFYKSLDGTLDKKNLIIDLRDNGGGGDRNSKNLYKLIKNYLKKNKVYIISNHRTASNAEQFIAKLNTNANCTILGHRTNGTVTYETGNANYNLPCDRFLAVLTHKKHKDYIKYESKGINPDVILDMKSNWLDQVVEYIQNN